MSPRPFTRYVKQHCCDVPLVGAEVGVLLGENAETILNCLNMGKLYLIDAYRAYEDYAEQAILAERACGAGPIAAEVLMTTRLSAFKDRCQLVKKLSVDAAQDIPDGLDFVYIDANHAYEYVKADIQAYFPKVRTGGVMGGHDFGRGWVGCTRAVEEMTAALGQELQHADRDWWWEKTQQ